MARPPLSLMAAALLGAAPAAALAASPIPLTITFSGLQPGEGQVVVAVYDAADRYQADRTPVAQVRLPAARTAVEASFPELKPGRYAVKAFYDLNGDGRLNTNLIGIPVEPYAYSNGARGRFGPARWADAAFDLAIPARQTIVFGAATTQARSAVASRAVATR